MTGFAQRVVIALAALALGVSACAESRARVRVFPLARIEGDSVTVADLLPAGAPGSLRARAARVVLGATPLAGSPRRFSREEIASRVGPELARELEIPESVVVERKARELAGAEVLAAIRATLGEKGFVNAGAISPQDVRLGMPVMVTAADPGLRVVGMKFDPALHLAVFRLWTAKEPAVRPFDVMVRPVDGLAQWLEPARDRAVAGGAARAMGRRVREAAVARRPRGKPLVLAWRPASLVLVSGTMEIHTTVEPLERGYLGQVIRVRMKSTRQIFRAKVVGVDCLEAGF